MPIVSPLNIDKLIQTDKLKEVTSPVAILPDGSYHPEGLFSENIFGKDFSNDRKNFYAYITLHTNVLHPLLYKILNRLDGKLIKLILMEDPFYYDKQENKLLTKIEVKGKENQYKKLVGFSGFDFCMENNIFIRGETPDREKLIKKVWELKDAKKLYFNKLLVIPPTYRPILIDRKTNSIQSMDDINLLYISILQLVTKIKTIGNLKTNLVDLLRKDIQNRVNELYELGKVKSGKKTGVIRSSLLGKRSDFSARSVIAGDPTLKIGECGLPLKIAAVIFEPFILHHVFKVIPENEREKISKWVVPKYGETFTIFSMKKFLFGISKGHVTNKEALNYFIKVIQDIVDMNDKVVILKRDPALHRLSLQAYKPKIYNGDSIKLQQLQTTGHNADFDGDSVYCFIRTNINIGKTTISTHTCHISELATNDYFNETSKEIRKNNVVVTKYSPKENVSIEVMTINPKTGAEEIQKVEQFSKHENLEMYKIEHKEFETFHASADHSLIIYDEETDEIKKISPKELLKKPKGKYLLKGNNL